MIFEKEMMVVVNIGRSGWQSPGQLCLPFHDSAGTVNITVCAMNTSTSQRTSHFLNITFDIKYVDLDRITWLTEWYNSTCWRATAITKVLPIQECKLWVQFLSYLLHLLSALLRAVPDTQTLHEYLLSEWNVQCWKLKALSSPGQQRK